MHRWIQLVPCWWNELVFLCRWLFRCTVFETWTGGETVSLPVASILTVVTTTLGAWVDPDGLSCRNHLGAWCIDVAVRTWREMSNRSSVTVGTTNTEAHKIKWTILCIHTHPCMLFSAYHPCILGSISRAGRWGWHMVEGRNLQLDSVRCHHCHKCTAHILMAGNTHTHIHIHKRHEIRMDHISSLNLSLSPCHTISKGGAIYHQFPAANSSYIPTYHTLLQRFRVLEENRLKIDVCKDILIQLIHKLGVTGGGFELNFKNMLAHSYTFE